MLSNRQKQKLSGFIYILNIQREVERVSRIVQGYVQVKRAFYGNYSLHWTTSSPQP
jgi:hypothetical protein